MCVLSCATYTYVHTCIHAVHTVKLVNTFPHLFWADRWPARALMFFTRLAVLLATSFAAVTKCFLATGLVVLWEAVLHALHNTLVCFAMTVAAARTYSTATEYTHTIELHCTQTHKATAHKWKSYKAPQHSHRMSITLQRHKWLEMNRCTYLQYVVTYTLVDYSN